MGSDGLDGKQVLPGGWPERPVVHRLAVLRANPGRVRRDGLACHVPHEPVGTLPLAITGVGEHSEMRVE